MEEVASDSPLTRQLPVRTSVNREDDHIMRKPKPTARQRHKLASTPKETSPKPEGLRAGAVHDIQTAVPYLFNRTTAGMHDLFVESLRPYKLTIPMWRVMVTLYGRGPLRFSALATLTSTELPTLSRIVEQLLARKLINKSKSDDDGRGVLIDITDAGWKMVLEIYPSVIELENAALAGFSEDEKYLARRVLSRICENISPLRVYRD